MNNKILVYDSSNLKIWTWTEIVELEYDLKLTNKFCVERDGKILDLDTSHREIVIPKPQERTYDRYGQYNFRLNCGYGGSWPDYYSKEYVSINPDLYDTIVEYVKDLLGSKKIQKRALQVNLIDTEDDTIDLRISYSSKLNISSFQPDYQTHKQNILKLYQRKLAFQALNI